MTEQRPFLSSTLQHLSIFSLFSVFVGSLHWEVVSDLSKSIMAGYQSGSYFAWLFWHWNEALTRGLPLFYTNLVMYPTGVPLFFHSPVAETAALILQQGVSRVATLNLLLMASYALTGTTAFALFERLTQNKPAALLGAFFYAFSGYMIVQHHHGHVTTSLLFFNPLLALATFHFLKTPRGKSAALMAGALIGVILSDPYVAFSFGFIFLLGAFLFDVFFGEKLLLQPKTVKWLIFILSLSGLAGFIAYFPAFQYAGEWKGAAVSYSTALLSFIDLPFWHESSFIQALRLVKGPRLFRESFMAYLGLVPLFFLVVLIARRKAWSGKTKFWLWIFCFSAILSLGPWLQLGASGETTLPLPYQIFSHLPFFSSFRVPSRILMTTTLASSALAGLGFVLLFGQKRKAVQWILCAGLLLFTTLEFDLWRLDHGLVSARPSEVYDVIRKDNNEKAMAILEIPSAYNPDGDLGTKGTYYMLMQTFHKRPMVLGFPARYLPEALQFTEKNKVIYELTHPWVLEKLETDPQLKGYAEFLRNNGSALLREYGIQYVVAHPEIQYFNDAIRTRLDDFLLKVLGPPILVDSTQKRLYETKASVLK